VIHNAPLGQRVDPRLSDQLRSRWGRDRPVILYAGSLEPYQRIPLLLEAMAVARDALPEARLVLVGGREAQVTEVTQQAARLGMSETVICEGQRPSDDIPSYLAAADVLVSPRRDGIHTPLKVYAYLQAGKPIVATRTTSHLQILDDQCAVLPELTPQAIAEALLAVLRDPALSDRLSRAAAERARDFGVGSFLRGTAAAYRDLGGSTPSEQALQTMMASLEEVP
jgi:glycosyltransferase involved in cell wall biosynthesis